MDCGSSVQAQYIIIEIIVSYDFIYLAELLAFDAPSIIVDASSLSYPGGGIRYDAGNTNRMFNSPGNSDAEESV